MKKSVYLSSLLTLCFCLFAGAASAAVPVVTNPHDTTACTGGTVHFAVDVSPSTGITYVWQVSTDGGTAWDTVHDGGIYSTATTDSMNATVSLSMEGYMYRVIAINTDGKDTSNAATLHVEFPTAAITGASSVCKGSSITLASLSAGGTWSNVSHATDTTEPGTGIVTGLAWGYDTVKYTDSNSCGRVTVWKVIHVDTNSVAYPITGPTLTCVGHVINLMNINTVGTRAWTASNGNVTVGLTTGVVTGVMGGLDTITYTFTNSCNSVSSTTTVMVDTVINPGTIAGLGILCSGSWTGLTASTPGGIWISSNSSIATVSGGTVTGVSHGAVTISYFFSNGCGVSAATHPMTIDTAVSLIGGGDSVGIGHTIVLTNTVTGGTWSIADTSIAKFTSAGSDTVKGLDTGSTVVTYTATNDCGTTSVTMTLYVGPAPSAGAIVGPDTVCLGATMTLSNTLVPGGVWHSKYDTVATIDSVTGVVTGVGPGADSIFYTYTNAFGSRTIKKKIFVHQPPVIVITGPATISMGGSYNLYATPTGGTWTQDITTSAPLIGYGFFVVVGYGRTVFTYTATNTCGTSSDTFSVYLPKPVNVANDPTGGATLKIYPNPSQGSFVLNLGATTTEAVDVTISNATGVKVKEFKTNTNEETNISFDQPAGIYIISATTASGKVYSTKISVDR